MTEWKQTGDLLRRQADAGLHRGAQVWVARAGSVIADIAVGEAAEAAPLTSSSPLLWMSSGKPLMAVALALEVQKKNLAWDDPVADFIPEFAQAGKGAITLRHVLTHTCGLRHADRIGGMRWADVVREICALGIEPRWEVGTTGGYHVGGTWVLLGEVLRRVDGRLPDAYYREEMFSPLGMRDSGLGARGLREPLRIYHTDGAVPVPHSLYGTAEDLAIPRPGRNSWGPARDLGKFYLEMRAALQGRGQLLEAPTARDLVHRHREGIADKTFGHPVDFGLGFYLNSHRYQTPGKTISYGYGGWAGNGSFGHSGAQSSCAYHDPDHDLTVAWITNSMPGEPRHQQRILEIQHSIYQELDLAGP